MEICSPEILLRLGIGDAVHDDVAGRAEEVVPGDDPFARQAHAELVGQRLGQLDLEAVEMAVLAGEGQGVRVGAERDGAARLDVGEAARRRRRGGGRGQQQGEEGEEAGARHGGHSGFRLRM